MPIATDVLSSNTTKSEGEVYNIMWYSLSVTCGRWFCPGPPVSSTNKTDRHDKNEILLKVALKDKWHKQIISQFCLIWSLNKL